MEPPERLAQIDAANEPTVENSSLENRQRRKDQRLALISRLDTEGAHDLSKRLDSCGQEMTLVCTCCGNSRASEVHCMARYCPSCQPLVVAERISKWKPALERIRWPLFMTLTIPNAEDPEQLRFLKKRWSAFRRRKLIRDRIKGGLATFEVTNTGNGWHPHLHALADCRWLSLNVPEPTWRDSADVKREKIDASLAEVTALWSEQIGVPRAGVHVRRAYGERVIAELCKYAAKGSDLIECAEPIAPMLRVLKSTRTLAGWGSCFPLPCPDEGIQPKVQCRDCGAEKSMLPAEVVSFLTRGSDTGHAGRTVAPPFHNEHDHRN